MRACTISLVLHIVPALILLSSCQKSSFQVQVGKVLIDDALGSDGVKLSRDQIRQSFVSALAPGKLLRFVEGAAGRLRVKAMAGRVPPGAGGRPVVVLRSSLKFKMSNGGGQQIESTTEFKSDSVDEQPSYLIEQAVARNLGALHAQLQLQEASPQRLLQVAQGNDHELRLRALSLLANKRDPATLDGVLTLFDDEDEAIVLRAVGVVVAIGDPRGVRALTDLTHRRSPTFVRQIVYAVAAIGGREAEAYLFTVATGHPDPGVQDAARRAAKSLASTSGTARPRGDSP